MTTLTRTIGQNVRRLRKEKGLTQRELSHLLSAGMISVWSQSRIAQLELGGRRDLDFGLLLQLAFVLGRPLSELLVGANTAMIMSEGMGGHNEVDLWEAILYMEEAFRDATRELSDFEVLQESVEGAASKYLEKSGVRPEDVEVANRNALDEATKLLAKIQQERYDADERLAERLGVSRDVTIGVAMDLFGRTLTHERDVRAAKHIEAGQDLRTARGHQTRSLGSLVEEEIARRGERTAAEESAAKRPVRDLKTLLEAAEQDLEAMRNELERRANEEDIADMPEHGNQPVDPEEGE